ncbi:AIG2-like protein C isoform X3 [Humulus lupulus]|uniref:AIG2-like protein C isoform X3 n=1 Tax=Humulus lupulus TaxID=3486 RepID=UPI002B40A0CA|nr:AIG2-like protein C isoform X3 [Humulus lupulus]
MCSSMAASWPTTSFAFCSTVSLFHPSLSSMAFIGIVSKDVFIRLYYQWRIRKSLEGFVNVLTGITEPELYILDTFEDDEYERHTVEVSLEDSSGKLLAHTYVWSSIDDPNLYGEWDFEEWKQLHMKDFVVMTKGFVEELNPPESKTRVSTYESFYKQEGDDNHPAS